MSTEFCLIMGFNFYRVRKIDEVKGGKVKCFVLDFSLERGRIIMTRLIRVYVVMIYYKGFLCAVKVIVLLKYIGMFSICFNGNRYNTIV